MKVALALAGEGTELDPPAALTAGERTGKFRLGSDQLLTAADGKGRIGFKDDAVAPADEIEKPAHIHKGFTVGYWGLPRAVIGPSQAPPAGTDRLACARPWGRSGFGPGSYCVWHGAAI